MPLPPVRADHVGSLLRPDTLRRAHSDRRAQRIGADALQASVEGAIKDAVRRQEKAGLRVVTDGEFRRGSWFLGFVDAVDGIALAQVPLHGPAPH